MCAIAYCKIYSLKGRRCCACFRAQTLVLFAPACGNIRKQTEESRSIFEVEG